MDYFYTAVHSPNGGGPPHCADEEKHGVVEKIIVECEQSFKNGDLLMGQKIRNVNTVNGIRLTLEDGTWGLVRASSNTPNLVVVVESPTSEENKIGMLREIEAQLAKYNEIGENNQNI